MQLMIFKDYSALSFHAAKEIVDLVRNKPDAVLCLASGDTPRQTYNLVAETATSKQVDFSRCTFVGLDEWVGISPDNEGSCHYFLYTHLFEPLRIQTSHIHLFNGLSEDFGNECKKMDAIIRKKGGIDLIVVGVGMNGHVGFNEPGVPPNLYSHVVALDSTTQSVGQKYFKQSTELLQGITLGLQHLLESRKAIMMASGRKKAEVMRKALEEPVSREMPACIIRNHKQGMVFLDEEAAALIISK
ncbi:MAG: glucosamine-6-phosphate deaminase [Cyclobacteriaceae bacterium]